MTGRRLPVLLIACVLASGAAHAQIGTSATPAAGAPPVLSTVPDPPAGVSSDPGQMSGLPLQVGDLPPGIVVVRVIRRSFADNIAGQTVRLRVGDTDRVLSAVTSTDGRAQFDGLGVGERVQVRAAVGSEDLQSRDFQIPAQGGVRLVLVADVGAPTATGVDWPLASGSGGAASASSSPIANAGVRAQTPLSSTRWGFWFAGALGVGCGLAGLVLLRRRRGTDALEPARGESSPGHLDAPRTSREEPPLTGSGASPRRAEMFEQLVRLEKDYTAGRVAVAVHASSREALIGEIARLDASE